MPRSAAVRAALATKKSGRPSRSSSPISMSQAFSSLSTFWPKCVAERRQPLVDRDEARLGLRPQPCAGAGEIEMIAVEHARLLRRKPDFGSFRFQSVDALEERVVEIGFGAVAGEDRRDVALDRLELVIGRGAREIEKDVRTRSSSAPAALHGLDRVGEGRAAGFAATASISSRASFKAASNAGRKCRGSMRSNGGASKGPVQGSRSGFVSTLVSVIRAGLRGYSKSIRRRTRK